MKLVCDSCRMVFIVTARMKVKESSCPLCNGSLREYSRSDKSEDWLMKHKTVMSVDVKRQRIMFS